MDRQRLSLAVSTEPRDENSLDKDSQLVNCFIDKDPIGNSYVVKRPGFLLGTEGITTGINRGIYINPNGSPFTSNGNTPVFYVGGSGGLSSYNNSGSWSTQYEYNTNDTVYFEGEIWYSQIDVNPNPPPTDWDIEPYIPSGGVFIPFEFDVSVDVIDFNYSYDIHYTGNGYRLLVQYANTTPEGGGVKRIRMQIRTSPYTIGDIVASFEDLDYTDGETTWTVTYTGGDYVLTSNGVFPVIIGTMTYTEAMWPVQAGITLSIDNATNVTITAFDFI